MLAKVWRRAYSENQLENSRIQVVSADIAIGKIVETIKQASPGEAPFTLIIGAGFSHPYVPTAAGFVEDYLPRLDETFIPKAYPPIPTPIHAGQIPEWQRLQKQRANEEKDRRTASFWKKFIEANKSKGWQLELDRRGVPRDFRSAYKFAFHDKSVWPFQNKAEQRKYLKRFIQPNRFRLNNAHFMLASILGAQPGKGAASKVQSENSLFKFQAAFSRCVLTTNFDHFLQIALQAVNRLYFMSDTPELENEDLTDAQTDAIHLVYVHGSIHRHLQINNDEQINERTRIAQDLVPVLEKNGIIIIGYNGWHDAIVEALGKCKEFSARGLYWVDKQPDPQAKGAFSAQVSEILRRTDAHYVQAEAGPFMNRLHTHLVNGLPRLLKNPIAQIREMLTVIDFGELEILEAGADVALKDTTPVPKNRLGKSMFKDFKELTLQNLNSAENYFINNRDSTSKRLLAEYDGVEKATLSKQLARVFIQQGNLDAALPVLSNVVENSPNAPKELQIICRFHRGCILCAQGKYPESIADFTKVIDNGEEVTLTGGLFGRAYVYEKMEKYDNAFDDYNAIGKLPWRAPAGLRDEALLRRGWIHYLKGDFPEFLRDTESALNGLSARYIEYIFPEYTQDAGYNLGLALLANGRDEEAIAAYSKAITKKYEPFNEKALDDLRNAVTKWLTPERAKPCIEVLESFRRDS